MKMRFVIAFAALGSAIGVVFAFNFQAVASASRVIERVEEDL